MSTYTKEQLCESFTALGNLFSNISTDTHGALFHRAKNENSWFDEASVYSAAKSLAKMLSPEALQGWLSDYPEFSPEKKTVGLIMAGNIPFAGVHDLLSTLFAGHDALVKLSAQDKALMQFTINSLIEIDARFKTSITEADRLNSADAFIASGSDNSARYFEYYFKGKPSIIRKNRVSIGILDGYETEQELQNLGADILTYYGLGCRNISKILVPKGYEIPKIMATLEAQANDTIANHKYANNYDYNKALLLVNKVEHFDNGALLLTPSDQLISPIATVYYEEYDNIDKVQAYIEQHEQKLQCCASHIKGVKNGVAFGLCQSPALKDYPDNIDTVNFLTQIH